MTSIVRMTPTLILAVLAPVLLTSRCTLLAPLPPAVDPPPATEVGDPSPTIPVTPPTPNAAALDLLQIFAAQRRAALPWTGSGDSAQAAPDTGDGAGALLASSGVARAGCEGIAVRSGSRLEIDGRPFTFFGVNAHYLLDPALDEAKVEPILAEMSQRGINTVRAWYFPHHDQDRFERLLDAGSRQGIRFVVTLEDNVFKGINWFTDKRVQEAYEPHLDATVERFRDRPEILLWDLVNEPNCGEGRYDDDCLETIRGWLGRMALRVTARDPCRVVSTGMIGDGNFENEERSFRIVHRKRGIDIVSVHRRSTDRGRSELEFANDEEMPIFYGEIYDIAHDDGCLPLDGDQSPAARSERIKADLREAIDEGVDGYLLWDYTAGGFCSKFGYEADDPVWEKLARAGLPLPVPWR